MCYIYVYQKSNKGIDMENKFVSFTAFLLLAGCGGGGGNGTGIPTPVISSLGTGLPYNPMIPGSHLSFSIAQITAAHWNTNSNELIVDATGSSVNRDGFHNLVEQYSTNTCANFPGQTFYVNAYSFNDTGAPLSGPVDLNKSLQDGFFSDSNGVQYLGEAINGLLSGNGGEPVLSTSPVAGEHIHNVQTWYGPVNSANGGCGNTSVYETGFTTDYYTVRHVDSWNGFSDVWITSLIEQAVTDHPIYYGYAYARSVGQVGSWCWSAAQDHYSCGNLYVALKN